MNYRVIEQHEKKIQQIIENYNRDIGFTFLIFLIIFLIGGLFLI